MRAKEFITDQESYEELMGYGGWMQPNGKLVQLSGDDEHQTVAADIIGDDADIEKIVSPTTYKDTYDYVIHAFKLGWLMLRWSDGALYVSGTKEALLKQAQNIFRMTREYDMDRLAFDVMYPHNLPKYGRDTDDMDDIFNQLNAGDSKDFDLNFSRPNAIMNWIKGAK